MFCPEKLALAYREHMDIHVAGYFPSQYQLLTFIFRGGTNTAEAWCL